MPTHWQVRAVYHDPKIISPEESVATVRVDPIDPNGEILRGGRVLGAIREVGGRIGYYLWENSELGISGRCGSVNECMGRLVESLDRTGKLRIPGEDDPDAVLV